MVVYIKSAGQIKNEIGSICANVNLNFNGWEINIDDRKRDRRDVN